MHSDFLKPVMSKDQKARIKLLYKRDNYHGIYAIFVDFLWIFMSIAMVELLGNWFLFVAVVIIGARQRALASLLHEAAHGILFKSKFLNMTLGRVMCGWSIFQSFSAYRESHVYNHHPKIGEEKDDPDLKFMLAQGVYEPQTRTQFVWRFFIAPMIGLRSFTYLKFVFYDRFIGNIINEKFRKETFVLLLFHAVILFISYENDLLLKFLIYWYLPYIMVFSVIGWLSELSEHFPMMLNKSNNPIYESRNRYASFFECFFIGMHGDNYHLTHHLLPSIPHWNLEAATKILRENDEFRAWDDVWGGIFSSKDVDRVSLLDFVCNIYNFKIPSSRMKTIIGVWG